MRAVHYSVAMSLDGYIASKTGGSDWIVMDPEIDFKALFAEFDTLLMGRKTYEQSLANGMGGSMPGMCTYVFSTTLKPEEHKDVSVVATDANEKVAELKKQEGKAIWLMGGGVLFESLLRARLVDVVEVSIVPVLLGDGTPFLPKTDIGAKLALTKHRVYEKSGICSLTYSVR